MPLLADSPFDTINILPRPAPASSELASLVHDAGRLVVQARDTWGPAKSRPIQVQCAALPARKRSTLDISTLRAPHPGPNPDLAKFDWFGRTTVHAREAFDTFYQGLCLDHTTHEQAYVHVLEEAYKLQPISKGAVQADIWGLTYHLPWPLKRRFFLELVVTVALPPHPKPLSSEHLEQLHSWLTDGAAVSNGERPADGLFRSFLVISVPALLPDPPVQGENKIAARYASVEAVVESQSATEWCMVTQSDAGGFVKPFMANFSMASTIAADVPSFCDWAANNVATSNP